MLRSVLLLAICGLTLVALGLLPASHLRPATASAVEVFADQPGPSDHQLIVRAASQQRRAAAAAPAAAPSIPEVITTAFSPLGGEAVRWALQIAYCESSYDPQAVNSASDAEGLFQFLPSTWQGTPYASQSPFDPAANAAAAAWLLQTYGAGQWECQA